MCCGGHRYRPPGRIATVGENASRHALPARVPGWRPLRRSRSCTRQPPRARRVVGAQPASRRPRSSLPRLFFTSATSSGCSSRRGSPCRAGSACSRSCTSGKHPFGLGAAACGGSPGAPHRVRAPVTASASSLSALRSAAGSAAGQRAQLLGLRACAGPGPRPGLVGMPTSAWPWAQPSRRPSASPVARASSRMRARARPSAGQRAQAVHDAAPRPLQRARRAASAPSSSALISHRCQAERRGLAGIGGVLCRARDAKDWSAKVISSTPRVTRLPHSPRNWTCNMVSDEVIGSGRGDHDLAGIGQAAHHLQDGLLFGLDLRHAHRAAQFDVFAQRFRGALRHVA